MAIIKCKMCGGDLNLVEGISTAECEFCGSVQTIPALDDEKKLIQFERAERLRKQCEFDKASGIYETIVADFRQEAEAYWGLVLCKYGIEYVDDPATGRKIPTCHRSSFDSVMDDSNFEQALENADSKARRVYREEAKQIEELRKGILSVSSNEQPYDIFICYKETDENGDRTLDSVLAQDIYDSLKDHGYRTFFARITLEDKLGTEYEPYIFAALNSAKIMLVVGTDYEYFNAVWVKNEWSRFLKLMTKDKGKHLIPCYKGIDAYDMPKEFAKLQAQDLGKVGAMQDLLRGIEKILPRQQNTTVVQERVVVAPAEGGHKVSALLERGNMALEDGDWTKADSFFEDVLNNDPKNPLAYIGKALAQEKCPTIDALVRRRLDLYKNVDAQTKRIQEDTDHIREMAEKFSIPRYVEAGNIRKVYDFDRRYTATVAGRQKQYRDEESWWQNHELLARAEKFANGELAELQRGKKHLFDQLAARITEAQKAEARTVAKLEETYRTHLAKADKQAEELYHSGYAIREDEYQFLLREESNTTDPGLLLKLARSFDKLGTYSDSQKMAEQCRRRYSEEQKKLYAEATRQQALTKKQEKARKTRLVLIATLSVIVIAAIVIINTFVVPMIRYSSAESALTAGQYQKAFDTFTALGDYKDSADRAWEAENLCLYQNAENYLAAGKTTEAAMTFGKLGDFSDARARSMELWPQITHRNICAGGRHTVGLNADGIVVTVGDNSYGQRNTGGWTDIVAISAGYVHTAGLKADGTVVAVGKSDDGQCDVNDWTDITAIVTGYFHTVGLKANGTVVAVGDSKYHQCGVGRWTDIVAIAAGKYHTVGLKSDGTVVAIGSNTYHQCNVSSWSDIVAIAAGEYHTVGLKADGTVVAVGPNSYNRCDVDDWTDIVAIAAGGSHTVGLKSDGTVVAVGENSYNRCDTTGWTDIVAIAAGGYHTVGLKADGTVVAVGNNAYGQCDVDGWQNIRLPD